MSPDGSLVVVGSIAGVAKVVERASGAALVVDNQSGIPADFVGAFSPFDTMWTAPDTFALLGTFEDEWVVVLGAINDAATVSLAPAFPVADSTDADSAFGFAGYREDGTVLLHRESGSVAMAYNGDGTEAEQVDLLGPSRSAWIEPGQPVLRVDSQGTLTVGAAPVAGEYQWART